jgi:hypothetical protein
MVVPVAALILLGLAPVVIWNAGHDWITFQHLLGHANLPGGDVARSHEPLLRAPVRLGEFVGTQLLLVGPALILALVTAFRPPRSDVGGGRVYLLSTAAPTLVLYLLMSLLTDIEGNWAMGAYVTLLPLAGWGVGGGVAALDRMHGDRRRGRLWYGGPAGMVLWRWTIGFGLVVMIASLRLDLLAGLPGVGPMIPVGRLIGAREMGRHADELVKQLAAETGREPFVMADHYGRASLLAFYMPGHPTVYDASSRLGGRITQYDYWPDTNPDDLTLLGGRPALVVGELLRPWNMAFDRLGEPIRLRGEHKKNRVAFFGYGYHGLVYPDTPEGRE